jgi:RimJ/RimL family protein N-acetyltransferase
MLQHAFENLDCIRVEFMADALNEVSRQAILRLGAKEEGKFRQDAVFYSIIDSEWPSVKERLQEMMVRP